MRSAVAQTAGQRVGRIVAIVAISEMFSSFLVFFVIPMIWVSIARGPGRGAIDEECADGSCVIAGLPNGRMPLGVGILWLGVLLACLLVAWSPARWWVPKPWSGRIPRIWMASSPEFIRIYALVNAVVFVGAWGGSMAHGRIRDPDSLWLVVASVGIALLATVAVAAGSRRVPDDVRRRLDKIAAPLLPWERRARSGSARAS